MRRSTATTPCPVPVSPNLFRTDLDDTTTNIDFTTELRASFRSAKPKRPRRQSVQFAIHEDENEVERQNLTPPTALSRPPRRTHVTQSSRGAVEEKTKSYTHAQYGSENSPRNTSRNRPTSVLGQAPRRPTARLSIVQESDNDVSTVVTQPSAIKVSRPVRRGTIYIPNEDTTMPSVFMGIFSPIKDFDPASASMTESEPPMEMTGIVARMALKRGARKSMIGGTALRGALRPTMNPVQETAQTQDRYGQGGGKENVPPGATDKDEFHLYAGESVEKLPKRRTSFVKPSNAVSSNYLPPTTSLSKGNSPKSSMTQKSAPRTVWDSAPKLQQSQLRNIAHGHPKTVPRQPIHVAISKPRVPTRFAIPVIEHESALQKYRVLHEDVADPAMYEEEWLRHQEIVITQLVNNLFSASRVEGGNRHDYRLSRSKLLELYCSPAIVLMHQRLNAALLYGSLSIPQDTLNQGARLQNDLGLRKDFTDLWLNTYHLPTLEVGLEVVIGRECGSASYRTSEAALPSKSTKSRLRSFIEAFLIRNEDGKPDQSFKRKTAWSYQRTVLRSLSLVKILDLVKAEQGIGMDGCLFQPSSPFKSSTTVVHALVQMLNPAAGDPIRALNHINYSVSHVQHPLEEFHYEIENLAVDFRDGVLLTRIVELLLYPSASQTMDKDHDSGTTTIIMPEGDALDFVDGQHWPLSQHLKVPCQSRVVKLWNVQVALTALKNVKGMNIIADNITAEDVVDGFREKTIRLLWALVGKWGLGGLINWHDLRWEVQRVERNANLSSVDDEFSELASDDCSFEACKGWLKRWAKAVTSSKGVDVRNFTTSFADGKAFEAIIDEYEPYILAEDTHSRKASSLQDRLTRLGCSAQFSELFAEPKQTHIFGRDFVLAALAFLCSRLLAPSQRSRAATVIQRAWRRKWSRIKAGRLVEKRTVAAACADLVNSKREREMACKGGEAVAAAADSVCLVDSGETPTLGRSEVELASRGPTSPSESDIWLSL